jgi:cytoskeletal protein RodZ
VADQPTCLCIISGERLRGGDFVAALRASLRPHDQLEIIVDRRCGEPLGEWERQEERRQRPQVDAALRANGFAVIPAPGFGAREGAGFREASSFREASGVREDRNRLSRLVPSGPEPRVTFDDEDEERLEAIREFKRERSSSLVPWLVGALVVVATAAFLLSPTGQNVRNNVVQKMSPEAPSPSNQPPPQPSDTSTAAQAPVAAEKPVASAPARAPGAETPPSDRSARGPASPAPAATEPVPPRDTGATMPRDSSVTPPRDPVGTTPRDTGVATTRDGAQPPDRASSPRATTGNDTRGRARSSEPVRPGPSAPAPREAAVVPQPEPVMRASSPRFAGLPRVELVREGSASGGAYAVKIVDPAGKPLSDAEVLLIARMADGTLENVRMGFVPEQGTYRGTLPPVRSTPVDLRVRVITGDKRVEVPIGP